MQLSAQAFWAVVFPAHTLALACAMLRIWAAWRRGSPSKKQILSFSLMVLACLLEFASTSLSVPVLLHEIELRRTYSSNLTMVDAMYSFWCNFLYYASVSTVKLSYLIFYADLFARTQTRRIVFLYVVAGFWALAYSAVFLLTFLVCLPFSDNWNPSTTNVHCPAFAQVAVFGIQSSVNIASDIGIILVPLLVIQKLHAEPSEKLSLAVPFSVGGVSIIASIIRFTVVSKRIENKDLTWDTIHLLGLWSHAEVFFGIIAFALPTFRYIVRDAARSLAHWLGLSAIQTRTGTPAAVAGGGGGGGGPPEASSEGSHTGSSGDRRKRSSRAAGRLSSLAGSLFDTTKSAESREELEVVAEEHDAD